MAIENLPQEILIQRSQKGWTQQKLAEQLGTTQRTIAAWESGSSTPRRAMLVKIAKAFDLPEDYFLNAPGAPAPEPAETSETSQQLKQVLDLLKQVSIPEEKKMQVIDSVSKILLK